MGENEIGPLCAAEQGGDKGPIRSTRSPCGCPRRERRVSCVGYEAMTIEVKGRTSGRAAQHWPGYLHRHSSGLQSAITSPFS